MVRILSRVIDGVKSYARIKAYPPRSESWPQAEALMFDLALFLSILTRTSKGSSMQEKPSISPSVMHVKQEKLSIHLPVIMNIITAVILVLLIPFTAVNVLDTEYYMSLSDAWANVSIGLQSGFLYVDGGGAFLLTFIFFLPLSIWCLITLRFSLVACLRKKPFAKKSNIVWASILLGMTLLAVICLLFASSLPCIDEYHCALPLRPGVVVPTSIP